MGLLSDDLADIYVDLREGIVNRTVGRAVDDVIWEWRFTFTINWGRHALDALRVLACLDNELD
jgi:hypothetical protein